MIKKIVTVLVAFMHMGGKPRDLVSEGIKLASDEDYRNDWYKTVAKPDDKVAA